MPKLFSILYLCTANSARSVLAEGLTNHLGAERVVGYSAGSFPGGRVNPLALDALREVGAKTDGFRSKSWDEFAGPEAPAIDLVITVCDNAAGETCPIWPGRPASGHWGMPDPAAVVGSDDERRLAFAAVRDGLRAHIEALLAEPIETFDVETLRRYVARVPALSRMRRQ